MNKFQLTSLQDSTVFSQPVYVDSKFIVADRDVPLSKERLQLLSKWQFTEVFSPGVIADDKSDLTAGGVENDKLYLSARDDLSKMLFSRRKNLLRNFPWTKMPQICWWLKTFTLPVTT